MRLVNREAARRSTEAPEGGFTDLCRAYMADSSRLQTSTHQLYRRLIKRQVIPAFGAREASHPLGLLVPACFDLWYFPTVGRGDNGN